MTHALVIMCLVFQNAQTLKALVCKVCTIKVTLYWFQGKTSAHIWCSGSRVIKEDGRKYLYKTHLDHCSQWLLEGLNIQLKFNYVSQVKKNVIFFCYRTFALH